MRYQAGPGAFLLNVDGIAGYHVTEGRRIVIDAAPEAADEEIILFVMGSAMGRCSIRETYCRFIQGPYSLMVEPCFLQDLQA